MTSCFTITLRVAKILSTVFVNCRCCAADAVLLSHCNMSGSFVQPKIEGNEDQPVFIFCLGRQISRLTKHKGSQSKKMLQARKDKEKKGFFCLLKEEFLPFSAKILSGAKLSSSF